MEADEKPKFEGDFPNTSERPTHRPGPDDPDRYITKRKKGCYQARVFLAGERHYLGSFKTVAEARHARDEFLAGRRTAQPKFLRTYHSKKGIIQRIEIPFGKNRAIEQIAPGTKPSEAAQKAFRILSRHHGSARASSFLRRK